MKTFQVKVYDIDGAFLSTWKDVISDVSFNNEMNSAGGQLQISLARDAGDFGEGTDVDFGHNVKVYCFDKDAPNGTIIFQGYISSYTPVYTDNTIQIIVLGYGSELGDYIIEAGESNIITQDTQTTGVGFGNYGSMSNTQEVGQSFVTVGSGTINRVEFKLSWYSIGLPIPTNVSLYTGLVGGAGTLLTTSNTVNVTSSTLSVYSFVFNPTYDYVDGTNLHFEIRPVTPYFPGSDKYPLFIGSAGSSVYASGQLLYSYN